MSARESPERQREREREESNGNKGTKKETEYVNDTIHRLLIDNFTVEYS